MKSGFQWTMVWEQVHGTENEGPVRAQLQEGFDRGDLAICPRCRAMEARISTDSSFSRFHAFVECTCLVSDTQKFPVQTVDGNLAQALA